MRIATWNVNSLNARLEKVEWWLERAQPDVLLLQETKLADQDAPPGVLDGRLRLRPSRRGPLERRRDRDPARARRVVPSRTSASTACATERRSSATYGEEDFNPLDEARMLSGLAKGSVRGIYAPNGRVVGSPFYAGKLDWYERLPRWLRRRKPGSRRT